MKSISEQLRESEVSLAKLSTTIEILDELMDWATLEKKGLSDVLIDDETQTMKEVGQPQFVGYNSLRLKMAQILSKA